MERLLQLERLRSQEQSGRAEEDLMDTECRQGVRREKRASSDVARAMNNGRQLGGWTLEMVVFR
jgi:hypothetical protein